MIIKNVTGEQLSLALQKLNEKYENNIVWKSYEQIGPQRFRVTLRVINAKAGSKGRKLNQSFISTGKGIRVNGSACWHVDGDLFDILLGLNNSVVISAGSRTIDKNGGNWQDRNIGSMMYPIMYSEACECSQ